MRMRGGQGFGDRRRRGGAAALAVTLMCAFAGQAGAGGGGNPFLVDGLNATQVTMAEAIVAVCPDGVAGGNDPDFQDRCNGLAGGSDSEKLNGLQLVAPEQIASPNTQGTRSGGGPDPKTATIGARLQAFRAGTMAAVELEFNGERVSGASFAGLEPAPLTLGSASSQEGSGSAPRLGVYANGGYQFGEVDSTVAIRGFDFDNGGLTVGADYRVTDAVLVGAAFNWWRTDAKFAGDTGTTTSDTYGGSLYATWLPRGGLFINGIASLGGSSWDARRKIQYVSGTDVVDTVATGTPNGSQLTIAGGLGYEFHADILNIAPYAQVQYRRIVVDEYRETGGDGWNMLFLGQNISSITTAFGATIDAPISTSIGVVVPQIRGAWWHEYDDDQRAVIGAFLGAEGNGNRQNFGVFTDAPDRDYGNIGVAVSLTLPGGIAGFVDWDSLLGYEGISSNRLTLGVRGSFF